ncbi:MAG: N-acetylmuramoyl-L-alanine amidase, partial [Pseudomonadota bacterium]
MTALKALLLTLLLALPLGAEELSALAKVNSLRSGIVATGGGLELRLALSQPVPWRLRLLDDPPRLVIDAREVDWRGAEALAVVKPGVSLRAGRFRP